MLHCHLNTCPLTYRQFHFGSNVIKTVPQLYNILLISFVFLVIYITANKLNRFNRRVTQLVGIQLIDSGSKLLIFSFSKFLYLINVSSNDYHCSWFSSSLKWTRWRLRMCMTNQPILCLSMPIQNMPLHLWKGSCMCISKYLEILSKYLEIRFESLYLKNEQSCLYHMHIKFRGA